MACGWGMLGQAAHEAGEFSWINRVSVYNRANVGAYSINRLVKRVFRRRAVFADDFTVGTDADDVVSGKAAFVDAGRGDPDVSGIGPN